MQITRRAALRGTAAVATCAVAGTAVAAVADDDSAIAAAADVYWMERSRRETMPEYLTDAEMDAYMDARMGAYDAVMAIPANTFRGLSIKARIYKIEMAPHIGDYMPDADIYSLLSDIERLVGEV